MARPKGSPKIAGRKAGTPNKVTSEMRELVNAFLHENYPKLTADFNKLQPDQRIEFYIKLLDFVIPKLTRTEAKIEASTPTIDMEKLTSEERQQLYDLMDKAEMD